MKKIQIMTKGGLGNQLFQVSLAEYLYNKNMNTNIKIILNDSWYYQQNKRKFNLKEYYNYKFNVCNNKIKFIDKVFSYRSEKIVSYFLKKNIILNNCLDGYWQDIFFANFLNLKNFNEKLFLKNKLLPKKYFIIHFRGDDFFYSKSHHVINLDFYNRALKNFREYPIIAIGDENHTLYMIKQLKNSNITYYEMSEFDAFSSIINSSGGIASNSTFCWWGIYLSLKLGKNKFIFPEKWMPGIQFSSSSLYIDSLESI